MDPVVPVLQFVLSVVWLLAGFSKLRDPQQASDALRAAHPRLAHRAITGRSAARTLGLVEIGLGSALAVGYGVTIAAAASLVLLTAFVVLLLRLWRRGSSVGCGCLGGRDEPVTGRAVLRTAVLASVAAALFTGVQATASSEPTKLGTAPLDAFVAHASSAAGLLLVGFWLLVKWDAVAPVLRPTFARLGAVLRPTSPQGRA